jgi:hypothetical protein
MAAPATGAPQPVAALALAVQRARRNAALPRKGHELLPWSSAGHDHPTEAAQVDAVHVRAGRQRALDGRDLHRAEATRGDARRGVAAGVAAGLDEHEVAGAAIGAASEREAHSRELRTGACMVLGSRGSRDAP